MIREKFDEIIEDFNGRIKNPLIATFILVWLYFHWSLVYQFFNLDSNITSSHRVSILQDYIRFFGWRGMVFKPLSFSFISLITYYVIAILAKVIKVYIGKNLSNSILQKINPSEYVPRDELKILEKEYEKNNSLLLTQRTENNRLLTESAAHNQEIIEYENELEKLQTELNTTRSNIDFNTTFKSNLTSSILYLMSLNLGIKEGKLYHLNKTISYPLFLNGTWKISFSSSISSGPINTYDIIINNSKINKRNGETIGEIKFQEIDQRYHILKFIIISTELFKNGFNPENQFYLLKLNNNELIGIKNKDEIVLFEREIQ